MTTITVEDPVVHLRFKVQENENDPGFTDALNMPLDRYLASTPEERDAVMQGRYDAVRQRAAVAAASVEVDDKDKPMSDAEQRAASKQSLQDTVATMSAELSAIVAKVEAL